MSAPSEREVSLGLIREYLTHADHSQGLRTSVHLKESPYAIRNIMWDQKEVSDERLRELAEQCANALFDVEVPGNDTELALEIQEKNGWPRSTIHNFLYRRKLAA